MKNNKINKNNSINLILNLNNFINSINQNKFIIAISLILLNIGSKYINLNLTSGQEKLIKSISGEILIFAICFMASKDIIVSLIITLIFSLLQRFFLNESSNYCVLPDNFKQLINIIDKNNDQKVSKEEIDHVIKLLEKTKLQNNNIN